MGYASLLFLGIMVTIWGAMNFRGNISTIHWYNRSKVSETDIPKYGKAMGWGTMIMGISVALTGILQIIFDLEVIFYLIIAGVVIGISIMLYAQFKYNRGIF